MGRLGNAMNYWASGDMLGEGRTEVRRPPSPPFFDDHLEDAAGNLGDER